MFPPESLAVFASSSVLLAISPGPDNLFVLAQSAVHGRRAGLLVTLGLCTGLLLHIFLAALGIAVVFQSSSLIFNSLKIIGAGYLLYLAWQSIRYKDRMHGASHSGQPTYAHLYRRGIIMNVTNPKVTLFFLAFLPQFVNHGYGSVTLQAVVLGGLFIGATLIVFGSVAFLAGSLGELIQARKNFQRALGWIAALTYTLLALRLLLSGK